MLQQFIVYAIVLVAAVYAAWRLMPAAWRTQLASRLAGGDGCRAWRVLRWSDS